MRHVPELSFDHYARGTSEQREAFCRDLFEGLTRFGFVTLKDHGISHALLDRAYSLSEALFAQAEAEKRRYVGGPRGYAPFRTERAKNSRVADLKEFWQIGPERDDAVSRSATEPPNIWPQSPASFREIFIDLFTRLEATGRAILEALTESLSVSRDYFAKRVDRGNSVLRLLHYPPIPVDVDPDSIRAAAHEDINLLTLLVAAQGPGLELLDRDGHWLPVETDRNNLIIDSGDMLARLMNDVIPATTHRVVNPSGPNVSRYSMPFFMHPNSDVVLSCIPSCVGSGAKYPDISADAFLEQRLKEIGLLESVRP